MDRGYFPNSRNDFHLEQVEWSQTIDSTMKIRDNNNLKEFSIPNLRNNLFFNLGRAKNAKDITEEERNVLERCSYCNQKGSSFHSLVLCAKSVSKVWELAFRIL